VANAWYNRGKKQDLSGEIDLTNDTIKVMLVGTGYTFNADHATVDDGSANDPQSHELSGTGYAGGYSGSGRKTLASKAFAQDDANDRGEFDAADLTWAGINAGTAKAAIVFKNGAADDTTSQLIAYIDTGGFPIATNGGDLTIQWNAEGILHLS